MSAAKRRPARKPRDLLRNRLEMVSKDLFKKHFAEITDLVGHSPGIYALYDGDELYYVGKSTELRKRVRHHLRDRHLASWTHFSLYLVRREEHIHEIESLLVRIANPKGNRVIPRGKSRGALIKTLKSLVRRRQREEFEGFFGSEVSGKRTRRARKAGHPASLAGLVSRAATLYRQYKGRDYEAKLKQNGTIVFRGKAYKSPSGAAKAVLKSRRAVNGWSFWYIKDDGGNWVRLMDYRP